MRRASWPEAIRAIPKVMLVERFQKGHHGALQDLVFKGGDADRPRSAPISLGNMGAPHRRRPVTTTLGRFQQALNIGLEVVRRLAINPDGAVPARHKVGRFQPLGIDMMRQRSEGTLREALCQRCYLHLFRGMTSGSHAPVMLLSCGFDVWPPLPSTGSHRAGSPPSSVHLVRRLNESTGAQARVRIDAGFNDSAALEALENREIRLRSHTAFEAGTRPATRVASRVVPRPGVPSRFLADATTRGAGGAGAPR